MSNNLTPNKVEELRNEEIAYLNAIANDSFELCEAEKKKETLLRRINYSYHLLRDIREKLAAYRTINHA